MDVMLNRMEELAAELQATILEKTKVMDEEKAISFQLFTQVLPRYDQSQWFQYSRPLFFPKDGPVLKAKFV